MTGQLADEPDWYRRAVIYQVNVRSFFDADGNGIGDFKGITEKLDYLQELGVNALWIMPFYPSPLRDDGYDIADYLSVNPMYGKVEDVRELIAAAHARGLRIITELIINHTSDQHPWFQAARRAPKGSPERDFYVWSDDNTKYAEARIIFKDFEASNWSWDEVAGQYYWHRFFHHQPDLNFDNPAVHEAVFATLDFWMDLGVDGFRLDAIPYLYEREGTTGENLPETHAFLKQLRAHLDAKYPNRMLLAEANQWPEDTRPYFGDGDECHMNYNFPIMPRLYMSVQQEDRFPIMDILEQTPEIPAGCQWAMFLRNHDELTLEMVTEEERDYMWRTYSPDPRGRINLGIRRRIAPLLEGDRDKLRLLNSLLLSLPGTPVLYYGDEIGMGDNLELPDRFGVRTPMQWSAGVNAGFSTAAPEQLLLPVITDPKYAPAAVNVEQQAADPSSHLNWMRRILNLRGQHPVFGEGGIRFLAPANQKVLAYVREDESEQVLVVANLAGSVQSVELDLAEFAGSRPVDLFGGSTLAAVDAGSYRLTLPPHGFYWLALAAAVAGPVELTGDLVTSWPRERAGLEPALAAILSQAEFAGRPVQRAEVLTAVPLPSGGILLLVTAAATGAEPEVFVLPLSPAAAGRPLMIANAGGQRRALGLAPAVDFAADIAKLMAGDPVALVGGRLEPTRLTELPLGEARAAGGSAFNARIGGMHLKAFRRATFDPNPEWELGRHLTAAAAPGVPPVLGGLEFVDPAGRRLQLAVASAHQPSATSGWDFFAGLAERELAAGAVSSEGTVAAAAALGRRLGELHNCLAAGTDPALGVQPFTSHYQRSIYASVRSEVSRLLQELAAAPNSDLTAELTGRLLAGRPRLLASLAALKDQRIDGQRIRVHGSMHLANTLVDEAGEFWVVDWEGDAARHLSERRLRLSPWRDVASLLQSFEHVGGFVGGGESAALAWVAAVQSACLTGYRQGAAGDLLTEDAAGADILLRGFRLELDARLARVLLARGDSRLAAVLSAIAAQI